MIRVIPLTDPGQGGAGLRRAWVATDAAQIPVGSAFLRMFAREGQQHLAEMELHVHPAERRQGTGTLLLAAVTDTAREEKCRVVTAHAEVGSPGEAFMEARGFRRVLTLVFTRLPLAEVDEAALQDLVDRPHPGYRLISWDGVVPDRLADTFAASRRALDDMPAGDADHGTMRWDVDQVRAIAQVVVERGDLLHTVAAVDETDGSIVAFTELVVPGTHPDGDGQHYGTGVLPEHRGHGLGRWMKASAVLQARERHPDLGGLLADTAEGNVYMRNINAVLGYRPTHTTVQYQREL